METALKHHGKAALNKLIKKMRLIIPYLAFMVLSLCFILLVSITAYEYTYKGKIYRNVFVGEYAAEGKTKNDIKTYWESKNEPFQASTFEFYWGDNVATISGTELNLGYDADLSATQAYLVGRSGSFMTDVFNRYLGRHIRLAPLFSWKTDILETQLSKFSEDINIEAQDALFTFSSSKVTAFKPSSDGRRVNIDATKNKFKNILTIIPESRDKLFKIQLVVDTVKPMRTTDMTNTFGINEQIGRGYSVFSGSIPGRIHNVALAASRFNGVLIAPNETFSFNKALGDVSAATGYQSAYIIKEGRTVLGDGGGVCQVSTTLFRAALDAGLPIIERHAHAYRVHYYEDGGYKAGLDATVFDPSADFVIKNNTPAYILIQTKTDTDNLTLEFLLYGKRDGRISQISNHIVYGISPPPPDVYQDDPTLNVGVVKQVDWAAWGAKASFDYKVTRGGEILENTSFFSNYRPWQAVYLKGTKI
jgi:vancomycin resistance protein YoaR